MCVRLLCATVVRETMVVRETVSNREGLVQ